MTADATIRLRDHLVVILHDQDGGPLKLSVILRELRRRGVSATESVVVNCMKRDPERFVRKAWGFYALRLGGGR